MNRKRGFSLLELLIVVEQLEANPGVLLPAIPALGTLDIRQVLSSPYFFA